MQRVVSLVVLTFVLAALAGVSAQEEGGPFPAPLAVGPGANQFYIFGSISDIEDADAGCGPALKEVHGNILGNLSRPYATNNPNDPCAVAVQPAGGQFEVALSQIVTGSGTTFTVYILPDVTGALLEDGAPVGGEVTLYYTTVNDQAPLVVGQVRPQITLSFGELTVGTWDGAPAIDPTALETGTSGGRIYATFTFDVGTAPADALPGPGKLVISFPNAAPDLRAVATKIGIAVDAEHRGHINIPFVAGSIPTAGDNNTTSLPDGNVTIPGNGTTDGNLSGPAAGGNNTTADGNSTDDADVGGNEKKKSPGVGFLAVGAVLVAFAVLQRRRGGARGQTVS